MRKLVILSVVGITVLLLFGCDNDPTPGGIYDVMLIDSQMNQCYGSFDTCSWTFSVSFKDNPDYDSHYYWAALERLNGPGEAIGKPRRLCNEGDVMEASVTGYYFDSIGFYALLVYRCDSAANVGNAKKATRSGELKDIHPHISEGGSQCAACCCSGLEQRYWAFAAMDAGDITGVVCSLDTKYGTLCGQTCGNRDSAHTAAWVSMSQEYADRTQPFIQFGYMRGRGYWTPVTEPDEQMYVEGRFVGGSVTFFAPILWQDPPSPESRNDIKIDYDPQADKIWLYRNDTLMTYLAFNPASWTTTTGQWAIWSGEIRGFETDMPGTYSDRCHFIDCKFRSAGTAEWSNASFRQPPDKIGSSDDSEWDLDFIIDTDDFEIWDINTQ